MIKIPSPCRRLEGHGPWRAPARGRPYKDFIFLDWPNCGCIWPIVAVAERLHLAYHKNSPGGDSVVMGCE